ncbi:MAG: ABC transporter substrate-binding protein [Granulosicoccaceae bacterium]
MQLKKRVFLALSVAASLGLSGVTQAQDAIKIGAFSTLEGAFAVLGEESIRGVEMALHEFNNEAGGKKIEMITGASDASPDSAVAAARKLVEQDKVQILIGPLSGSEGLAVKDYAKTQPQTTFLNGSSAAQDTTLRNPAENFFRFNPDGAQFVAGLGEYTYNDKGYKSVAIIAEDYSFPYTMVFGFMKDYCKLGGTVPAKFWVPIGTKDYSSVISALPDDVDALWVGLGGADAVNFLTQYEQAGGDLPMVAGSITVDQSVLGSKGRSKDYLVGTATASPAADTNQSEEYQAFVKLYQSVHPDGFPTPSLFAHEYYISTKAALLALDEVEGDLSDGHKKYREALSNLSFMTPAGMRSLDENRQVITDIFLTEVVEGPDGNLLTKLVKRVPQVNQTLGEDMETFLAYGVVGRDNPDCK